MTLLNACDEGPAAPRIPLCDPALPTPHPPHHGIRCLRPDPDPAGPRHAVRAPARVSGQRRRRAQPRGAVRLPAGGGTDLRAAAAPGRHAGGGDRHALAADRGHRRAGRAGHARV